MAARLTLLLPRLAVLVVIWLLAAASFTYAAGSSEQAPEAPAEAKPAGEKPKVLVVPDVRGQTYVFAKGILQDDGFAWRVQGDVEGHAANTVAVQNPAPGIRVVDNGAPTVLLRLDRSEEYAERGLPENSSPYKGTAVVLLRDHEAARPAKQEKAEKPEKSEKAERTPKPPPAKAKRGRKPDFVVPGAVPEPPDEMPLPDRARLVERRLAAASEPTREVVRWWLYQHSWIVTGSLYGWKDGDEALRILIRVDRDVQARLGFGARSEQVARRALAEVLSKKG